MQRARVPGRGFSVVTKADYALNETAEVLQRTKIIHNAQELEAALTLAADNLVMLSVESEEECTMSDDANAWAQQGSTSAGLEQCKELSASLARMARDAVSVTFLKIEVVGDAEARDLANSLGVHTYPTHQYYKHGELLWQHVGAGAGAETAISEGILYYGGQGAGGLVCSDYITEVGDRADLENFLQLCAPPQQAALGFESGFEVPCEKQLAVLDVSQGKDAPAGCLHIYPAVVSLARNTAGFTRWARLRTDASPASAQLAKELEREAGFFGVPTFLFYANGQLVDKYVGSDRLELMNKVLDFQKANGIKMPQRSTPKRMSTAEARQIAKEARERAKQQGMQTGW